MERPRIHEAVRRAIDTKFGSLPATQMQVGDDLPTAFARKLGIPLAERPVVDPMDEPRNGTFVNDKFGRVFYKPTRRVRREMGVDPKRGLYQPQRSPRRNPVVDDTPRVSVVARRERRAALEAGK